MKICNKFKETCFGRFQFHEIRALSLLLANPANHIQTRVDRPKFNWKRIIPLWNEALANLEITLEENFLDCFQLFPVRNRKNWHWQPAKHLFKQPHLDSVFRPLTMISAKNCVNKLQGYGISFGFEVWPLSSEDVEEYAKVYPDGHKLSLSSVFWESFPFTSTAEPHSPLTFSVQTEHELQIRMPASNVLYSATQEELVRLRERKRPREHSTEIKHER